MRRLSVRLAAALATATVVGLPAVAFAHAHVVSTRPGAASTLDAPPTRLAVVFDDPVTLVPHALQLTDASGALIHLDPPHVSADGTTLGAGVHEHLAAGDYRVAWRVRSDDGHIETGDFTFDVAGSDAGAGGSSSAGDPPAQAPTHPPAMTAPPEPAQPVWPVATAAALAAVAGIGAGLAVHRSLRAARESG